ncbi:nuclease-related domain-containing protein [Macrococcus equipercicus]|uniref:NERD domain-containing protein n=1 Tax=Macrococcus equipercicus TaxID=69967 RepID=A0A9Q9BLX9_9STAP|nr:nuclease-related domain-containing protein [Macrococcus equipercicus]KAA1039289.1 NERD domain-containing protein [Macrococcus equipercicus]UTH13580.1 NERD domain-containing protein [Macrococcus equipercicus]
MLLKSYSKSHEFVYLEALEKRVTLVDEDYRQLMKHRSGLDGEKQFFKLLESLDSVVIWDLLLEAEDYAQYDFIVIAGGHVLLFDVKNNGGIYQYDQGNMIGRNARIIKDYRPQLERARYMLDKVLQDSGITAKITSRIVFINETFRLVGFDGDARVVFPAQCPQIVDYLNTLEVTPRDIAIGKTLVAKHAGHYPYSNRKTTDYECVDSRLRCMDCRQLFTPVLYQQYVDCSCGHSMKREAVMMANLHELMLIKNDSFTIAEAMDWTMSSRTTVKRFLRKHAIKMGNNRSTKYKLKPFEGQNSDGVR